MLRAITARVRAVGKTKLAKLGGREARLFQGICFGCFAAYLGVLLLWSRYWPEVGIGLTVLTLAAQWWLTRAAVKRNNSESSRCGATP